MLILHYTDNVPVLVSDGLIVTLHKRTVDRVDTIGFPRSPV